MLKKIISKRLDVLCGDKQIKRMKPEEVRTKLLAFYVQEVLQCPDADVNASSLEDRTSVLTILSPFLSKRTVAAIGLNRGASSSQR